MDSLYQDWPVYLGVGGFAVFVIFAIITSRQQEKKDREAQTKKEDTQLKK